MTSQKERLERIREVLGFQLSADFAEAGIVWQQQLHPGLLPEVQLPGPLVSGPAPDFISVGPPREPVSDFVRLYHCWPGVGKTEQVTRLAEQPSDPFFSFLLQQHDMAVGLVLGLTHKSFENVTRGEGWAHWKGHDRKSRGDAATCQVNIRASKGYSSTWRDCNCTEKRTIRTGAPTFAPVEYVLTDVPGGRPIREEVQQYLLWVFDEVDFARFVGKMVVTRHDLEITAKSHTVETVRTLAQALLIVIEQHTAVNKGVRQISSIEHWSGSEFYEQLDSAFEQLGFPAAVADQDIAGRHLLSYMQSVLGGRAAQSFREAVQAAQADFPTDDSWVGFQKLPCNFAPRMCPLLWWGAALYSLNRPFNPLIHLVWDQPEEGQPLQSIIRFRWKKYVASPSRPIAILDASADEGLLKQVFGHIDDVVDTPELPFPASVHVYQLLDERVTRGTLGIGPEGGKQILTGKWRKLLQDELLVRGTHKSDGTPHKVGIISFKDIVEDCKAALMEVGYALDQIVTGYYYNLRGDNDFQHCDILVVLGYPIPDPQGLYEEACALYHDDPEPISRERLPFDDKLEMRSGRSLAIEKIPGNKDDRLHSLYLQKSRWELYQAFHRSRPLIKDEAGGATEVLIFTNVPIRGVKIDGFLDREGRMFDTLTSLFQKAPVQADGSRKVTKTDLVDAILAAHPNLCGRDTLDRDIRRKHELLESATGSEYVGGKSKSASGLFRMMAPSDH